MMKLGNLVGAALVVTVLLIALPGCQKKEGPAEQAGKSMDQAAEQAGEKIEQAGEKIQDAAKGDNK